MLSNDTRVANEGSRFQGDRIDRHSPIRVAVWCRLNSILLNTLCPDKNVESTFSIQEAPNKVARSR